MKARLGTIAHFCKVIVLQKQGLGGYPFLGEQPELRFPRFLDL